ncbi:uncharacterized protein LOC105701867 [Orussus abietinus]|uniref:uncharacterized protein LOC105701867 n=1 Tax=Orussus abietinus TaxID=222816 RepID=UPI000625F24F|nr:uncharacterized protein LOC105701867 [Orussus abietinus]
MEGKRRVLHLVHLLVCLVRFQASSAFWNFSEVQLPRDVLVWRFAIWRNRAFLAIPRWERNSTFRLTLVEAPWPEEGPTPGSGLSAFPNPEVQVVNSDCRNLHSVTGLAVDARGRLWVLDAPPGSFCPPRILLYDLRKNEQIGGVDLIGVPSKDMRSLAIDSAIGPWGVRAYAGDPGDETIVTYSPGQRRWWRLKMVHGPNVPRVYSTEIAVSRKVPILYLTGYQSQDLFGIGLEELRNEKGPLPELGEKSTRDVNATWLGTKMGSSSGLICDLKFGLHYFMVTERASVRWDTRQEPKAESHSVLLQKEDVPCLTDYEMDSQKSIWGLVNSACPLAGKPPGKRPLLKARTVRVYKYNPFVGR